MHQLVRFYSLKLQHHLHHCDTILRNLRPKCVIDVCQQSNLRPVLPAQSQGKLLGSAQFICTQRKHVLMQHSVTTMTTLEPFIHMIDVSISIDSLEHWCDMVFPSVLSRAYAMCCVCLCMCVQSDV